MAKLLLNYIQIFYRAILFISLILFTANTYFVEGIRKTDSSLGVRTPCPNVFQYNWNGLEWYGTVTAPSLPFGTLAKLVVHLYSTKIITGNASIDLEDSKQDVLTAILTDQPIHYRVTFPVSKIIPLVTNITLNDKLLCTGPTEHAPIVTSITLEHTLHAKNNVTVQTNIENLPELQLINLEGKLKCPYDIIVNNNHNNHKNPSTSSTEILPIDEQQERVDFNRDDIPTLKSRNLDIRNKTNSAVCGRLFTVTSLVVNGAVTQRESHPWLVALFSKTGLGLSFICGATLISDQHVITAGHCIRRYRKPIFKPDEILLALGKHHLSKWTESGYSLRDASQILLHPEYIESNADADIAGIKLSEPVEFSSKIRPVCISSSQVTEDLVGKEGTIIGWGRDENGAIVTSEPRSSKLRVVSQEDCLRSRIDFRYITSNRTICAGGVNPGSGPCNGDSGGGLVIWDEKKEQWFLRGVISMSLMNPKTRICDLNDYSVYVDISKFAEWLVEFLK